MIKQQHMIITSHGQRERTRSVPVFMFEIRRFPAEVPAAAPQPAPEALAQEKLPLTSKYHFGNWNTQSEL